MKINGPKTLLAGAVLAMYRLVKLSTVAVVYNTDDAADEPIGVTLDAAAAIGDPVAVENLAKDGTLEIEAAGAITAGVDVYAAANGRIQALPDEAGTYRRIGKALQAASGAASVIEVLPYGWLDTVTVEE